MSVVRIPPTLREDTRGEREVVADGDTVILLPAMAGGS